MTFISRRKAFVSLIFIFLMSAAVFFPREKEAEVFSQPLTKRIVLDAGHGFPDGGAIGISGTVESTLNLKIARYTQELLKKRGYTVIMTRSDDNALTEEGRTLAQRKRNDMYERLNIINSSDADMFISVHINKFTDSRYNGAQVIYSGNFTESARIASSIQEKLCLLEDNKTKRSHIRSSKKIFLLENAAIPAVIVECGFLSNFAEEQLLLTEEYQRELAKAITAGIEEYYKSEKEN